jgi:hypothetical protein
MLAAQFAPNAKQKFRSAISISHDFTAYHEFYFYFYCLPSLASHFMNAVNSHLAFAAKEKKCQHLRHKNE